METSLIEHLRCSSDIKHRFTPVVSLPERRELPSSLLSSVHAKRHILEKFYPVPCLYIRHLACTAFV